MGPSVIDYLVVCELCNTCNNSFVPNNNNNNNNNGRIRIVVTGATYVISVRTAENDYDYENTRLPTTLSIHPFFFILHTYVSECTRICLQSALLVFWGVYFGS